MLVAGSTALAIVTVSYMLVNVAYFAAVPRDEIVSSGITIAGQFFLNVRCPRKSLISRSLAM
jgi:hypothetical protein